MSRLGKKPIKIPPSVTVTFKNTQDGTEITASGPKGTDSYIIKNELFSVENINNELIIKPKKTKDTDYDERTIKALWGTSRSHLQNLIDGVSKGFVKELEIQGLGFKAELIDGKNLKLFLGYTNPIIINAPEGIKFEVNKNIIKVSGINKNKVGQVAGQIRKLREPDPYKWIGVRYVDEKLIKKIGKKLATTK